MLTVGNITMNQESQPARDARGYFVTENPVGNHDVIVKTSSGREPLIAEYYTEDDCHLIAGYSRIMDGLLYAFSKYDRVLGQESIRQAEILLQYSTIQEDVNKTWGLGGNEQDFFYLTLTLKNGTTARIGGSLYVDQATASYIQQMPENLNYILKKVQNIPLKKR